MGYILPYLIIGGAGVTAAGQIQAGREAAAQGASEERIAQFDAELKEREAKAITQSARFEQWRQAKEAARTESTLLARLAASGTITDAGTPLILQTEQLEELELENALIGYEGRVRAKKAREEAAMFRMEGELAKRRGKSARKKSYFEAGSTILQGFATAKMFGGGGGGYGSAASRGAGPYAGTMGGGPTGGASRSMIAW